MISLLITVLILLMVFGLIGYAVSVIPLPPPFATVVNVFLAIILILVLVSYLLPYAEHPPLAIR